MNKGKIKIKMLLIFVNINSINVIRHSPSSIGRFTLGQNIGQGFSSWSALVKAWYDEVVDFTYNGTTNDFMKVGHYTQVKSSALTVVRRNVVRNNAI